MHAYRVIKGLRPPEGRRKKRTTLDSLVELAKSMEVGDAAVMTYSESQTFRLLLAALGFHCVTGYWDKSQLPKANPSEMAKLLVFKISSAPAEPAIDYQI